MASLCVWTAAESDPAVRPEPAILCTYYTLSNERIPFHKDKTEDDRFFVLTLIAIAEEITARGIGEKEQQHIQLAVGLPPAHFGSQAEKFTAYFQGRGLVAFMYGDKHYTISIEDVACYPQAYAAAATMLHALLDDPKAVVLDIGGFTADYLLLKNGKADLASCDSLETALSCYTIRSGPEEMQSWICCWMRRCGCHPHGQTDTVPGRGHTACGATGAGVCQRLVQHFTRADVGFALLQSGVCGRRRYSAAPADRGFRQGGNASVRHEHQRQCSWI